MAIGGAVWLFVGWCSAYGSGARARRARVHGAEREIDWADHGGRSIWANGFVLGWVFLAGTLPAAHVLRHLQHGRTEIARLTVASDGRFF